MERNWQLRTLQAFMLLLLVSVPALPQTVEKRTGDIATLRTCVGEGDQVHFYRKTSPGATPWRIGTKPVPPGRCVELRYLMPSGTTPEYRFFATPQRGTEFMNDTNSVTIKRIK